MNGSTMFDRREMVMVHDVLRRETGLAPRTVRESAADDTDRVRFVAGHIAGVIALTHEHHSAEDAMLWPLLEERCRDTVPTLVPLMKSQHARVADLSDRVSTALEAWRDAPSPLTRDRLVEDLAPLIEALDEHLGAEEEHVLPLMETHITDDEWNAMVRQGVANADPASFPVAFGMLMYEGDPVAVEMALKSVPPEVAATLRETAPGAYAAHAERLYGTSTPPRSHEL